MKTSKGRRFDPGRIRFGPVALSTSIWCCFVLHFLPIWSHAVRAQSDNVQVKCQLCMRESMREAMYAIFLHLMPYCCMQEEDKVSIAHNLASAGLAVLASHH